MLNYMAAEFYKLRKKWGLLAGLILLMGLESILFLASLHESSGFLQRTYLDIFTPSVCVGVMIAPVFAAVVYDGQESAGTLKNELVYGIPRSRIYLGKLLTGALTGTLCAAAAAGWYLLLTLLMGESSPAAPLSWAMAWASLRCNWFVWIAAYAWTFFLMMGLRNPIGALLASYGTTLIGLLASGITAESNLSQWVKTLARLFYVYPILMLSSGIEPENALLTGGVLADPGRDLVVYAAFVSALWVMATTALGLFFFRGREVP